MRVFIIRFMEGLFLVGVAGCLVTIPMAAWGYFSVLLEADPERSAPVRHDVELEGPPVPIAR